jgi:hypothetical protein
MAFKQKGSPFQRNFGIGKSPLEAASPAKDIRKFSENTTHDEITFVTKHNKAHQKEERQKKKREAEAKEKSPTEMKSPAKHLIGKHPAKDGHVRADHKKNRETKKKYKEFKKNTKVVDGKTYDKYDTTDYSTYSAEELQKRREDSSYRKPKEKSPVEMKSPVKDKDKIAKAKSRVQDAKETVTAYKEPGETRKLGTSIWQDTDMGTGETRATKKSERKLKRAEKKISKAEKLYAKGKTKRAERKLKRATKKADKAISIMTKHGSGRTKRTVQDKYKDDPRYKGEQAEYDSQFR